jgi:cytochrome c551/c552
MIRLLVTLVAVGWPLIGAVDEMDSNRGGLLFSSLGCVRCHNINAERGKVGPDPGQRVDRNFTPSALASILWNHAPTMWATIGDRGIRSTNLDEQGAVDLFAWFYFMRFFEMPGDAGRGKRLFSERHCAECHSLTESKLVAAKPVSQWDATNYPVALVNAMWNHASTMKSEFARHKYGWPALTSQDLADMLAYIRNIPGAQHTEGRLQLGSGERGQALFTSKGCEACHASGLGLQGQTLTDIAADMWNHSPRMGAAATSFELEEMRDLTTFLWARQFFLSTGDARAGKRIFASKGCGACHGNVASGAPKITGHSLNGASMVSALWRHGPRMMEVTKSKGMSWPRFDRDEMSNLIAYLNSVK